MIKTCPLCQHPFEGREACRNCGLVKNCPLLRCPNCGYEFVEQSKTFSFFSKLAARWGSRGNGAKTCLPEGHDLQADVFSLSEIPVSERCRLAFIARHRDSRSDRLAVYGLVAGSEIRVRQKSPATIIRIGETDLALDPEVVRDIFVTREES